MSKDTRPYFATIFTKGNDFCEPYCFCGKRPSKMESTLKKICF